MIELFDLLPRITLSDKIEFLIDTCFFIWVMEHNKQKDFESFMDENDCALTSFNAEELVHVEHRLHDDIKKATRKFLHDMNSLHILEIPVHPGNPEQEYEFVKSVLPQLDHEEHDPSDAVILAAAIKVGANVLTRDKHDMFNAKLKNFLDEYNVGVFNTFDRS